MATAPSAPTWTTATPDLFESTGAGLTMSWGGAAAGVDNPIQSYRIYTYTSKDKVTWVDASNWDCGNITSLNAPGTSIERGWYFRFRVVANGPTMSSGFSPYSNAIQHNTLPKPPTSVIADPAAFFTGDTITLSWSGAVAGLSGIWAYKVEIAKAVNGVTWGDWAASVTTGTTSQRYSTDTIAVGTLIRFRVFTLGILGVQSETATVSNITECRITACTAPTSCTISSTVAEGNVTLSWSGAASGLGNSISSYEIQYSESSDNVSWGSWYALTTVTTTATSGSASVSPPSTRGYYRRFQVRTRGGAGASYYSSWRVSSNTVRKNTLPGAPLSISVGPAIYQSGQITIGWSNVTKGTSEIKNYVIQYSSSADNATWGAWYSLTTVTTSATSGSYSYTPGTMSAYTQYRVQATDVLDAVGPFAYTAVVKRNSPPAYPLITLPKLRSTTFSTKPRIFIQTQNEPDGQLQTLYLDVRSNQIDSVVFNSVDNKDKFSRNGTLASYTNTVFKGFETVRGKTYTAAAYALDPLGASSTVYERIFTVAAFPFSEIQANSTAARAAHMLELRSAINTVRDYYDLTAYTWKNEIIAGKTSIKDWGRDILELRTALNDIITTINAFHPGGIFSIPAIEWLPIGAGRPRADVMRQLQDIILDL